MATFACNGYREGSPCGYGLRAGLLVEVVMTFIFLIVILGATDKRAPAGFAPIAIGLCLNNYQPRMLHHKKLNVCRGILEHDVQVHLHIAGPPEFV